MNNTNETREWESGEEITHNYFNVRVLKITDGDDENCPVQINQTYKANDNYPGSFKQGSKIVARVESISSMGPTMVLDFLVWHYVTYEDGSPIVNENNKATIISFQSESEPISITEDENLSEEDKVKDDEIKTDEGFNFMYIIIPLLGIVITIGIIYLFKSKRQKF